MSATVVDEKRRTTLPQSVFDAAGLKPNDQIDWRVEEGEIRGRKIGASESKEAFPPGSLLQYLTPDRDQEQLAILSGCVQGPIE
jgi:bifunctional DNA-binding transcriptional regulator/antitoxin component of YhaV-PrlF toxin-antitoxin module